jgi:hypothetical protein
MGPEAADLLARGLGFVTRMLRVTMQLSAPEILDDEIAWGRTRLPVQGVSAAMVARNFERYARALAARLSPAALVEIEPWLRALAEKQRGA